MTESEQQKASRYRVERNRRRRRRVRATVFIFSIAVVALVMSFITGASRKKVEVPEEQMKLPEETRAPIHLVVTETLNVPPEPEDVMPSEPKDEPEEETTPTEPDVQTDPREQQAVKALLAQGYISDEIPLSYEEQIYLRAACEESGTPFALALAVIQKETTFRNVMGDSGRAFGYMQVQQRWHKDRMERLGVTDLMDPFSNFRVGCDYLAELIGKYGIERGLTAYNTGSPGESRYSKVVYGYYEKWMEDTLHLQRYG